MVYGRLLESAHISGYGFERMTDELEWLLEDERWRKVGTGYNDVNVFLRSIDLSAFNLGEKKRLHQRIKELQPAASERAIAKATGSPKSTVHRHLKDTAPNGASEPVVDMPDQHESGPSAPNGAPKPAAPFQRPADEIAKQARAATARQQKEAERERQRDENRELVETGSPLDITPDQKYSAIVFDPPWSWEDEGDVNQLGRARPNYHTMTFDEIAALPIGDYAEPNAHIYLWITNRSLPKGQALLDSWGFRYITALTWCKPHFGMGNYFRGSTEHVLFGVKGSLPLLRKDIGTWFEGARGDGHSAKPETFYELVERCSPGPWVDILGRRERPGWATVKAIEAGV